MLSAEAGAYVNFEASWAPAGPRTALFAFLDAGRLTGTSSYSRRELASTGLGATWPLWKGASVTATAGFPLIRNLGAGERAGKALRLGGDGVLVTHRAADDGHRNARTKK